jgi:hypothetical protein
MFRPYFHLSSVSIEKLDNALLQSEDAEEWSSCTPVNEDEDRSKRETSVLSNASSQPDPKKESKYLQDFLTHILSPLLKSSRQHKLSLDQQTNRFFVS